MKHRQCMDSSSRLKTEYYFNGNEMPKFCETILPQLRWTLQFFVVHAEESRLSINKNNAGIGYTKI